MDTMIAWRFNRIVYLIVLAGKSGLNFDDQINKLEVEIYTLKSLK